MRGLKTPRGSCALSSPVWRGRAPGRVNLIGEHVDYVGGLVLPAAIEKFTEVEGQAAAQWSVTSDVNGGLPYVRAVGEALGAAPQAVTVKSEVLPGSGLSSSAALLVAVAAGLRPDLDGTEAALLCQRAEQAATGVQVGIMDQFASALGRRGFALLLNCETLEYSELPFPYDVLIAVIDSGIRRRLAETPYNVRRSEAERAVRATGMPVGLIEDPGEDRRLRHVVTEVRRVRDFADALVGGDRVWMGKLLDESHASLRDDFEVSTPQVDALVEKVRRAPGCLGARMMGAGFGGSVLALVDLDGAEHFRAAVDEPLQMCATADGAFVHGAPAHE